MLYTTYSTTVNRDQKLKGLFSQEEKNLNYLIGYLITSCKKVPSQLLLINVPKITYFLFLMILQQQPSQVPPTPGNIDIADKN